LRWVKLYQLPESSRMMASYATSARTCCAVEPVTGLCFSGCDAFGAGRPVRHISTKQPGMGRSCRVPQDGHRTMFLTARSSRTITPGSVITSAESAGPVAYASFLPIAIISGVFDPTFSGLPHWLSRLVAAFPVKSLAEILQNTYAVRPFPAWDLVDLGLWTAAGTAFALWRFRWHS
jgi:hypothetical protein